MKNIVIITSNDIRHNYFKIMFSANQGINIIKTFVESSAKVKLKTDEISNKNIDVVHLKMRKYTEYDYFSDIIEKLNDGSKSAFINKNEINDSKVVDEIIFLDADFVITYGCSIIKPKLIDYYKNKIINVHLGLSPYYYGAGTNYHALVNGDFQCVGYTLMYMDSGIDTGEVVHQARAKILPFDNPHQIGSRLIKDMTKDFIKLIVNFDLVKKKKMTSDFIGKTYRKRDATTETNAKLYKLFESNGVFNYLNKQKIKEEKYQIIEQEIMK